MTSQLNDHVFLDLITQGTVSGADASREDYADALRVVAEQAQTYYQLDDPVGEALCYAVRVQLLAAASRRAPVLPY